MISHNNSIYSTTFPHNGATVEKLYEHIFQTKPGKIKLLEIMQMIEYFSHSKTLISNTKYYFSKLKIQQKFKEKIELFESLKYLFNYFYKIIKIVFTYEKQGFIMTF
jgi:hypothetical protein